MPAACEHLQRVARSHAPVRPSAFGCEECLELGTDWVHLRICLSCGHVGCCDSSPNRHATHHFHQTKHPVIKSFEPGEDWAWCYVHEKMLDAIPAAPEERPAIHYEQPMP